MHQTPRLPTRVSTACDRCRRQKQRCDEIRPCSMCLRANADCTANWRPPTKSKRSLVATQSSDNASRRPTTRNSYRINPSRDGDSLSPRQTQGPKSVESNLAPTPVPESHGNVDSPRSAKTDSRTPAAVSDFVEGNSALATTRKIFGYQNSATFGGRATFAIPGGDYAGTANPVSESQRLMPISAVLGMDLPSKQACDSLLETYFLRVHWFSLVVYEPKFRARYNQIMDTGLACSVDHGFLLLLVMLLILGSWYTPKSDVNENLTLDGLENMRDRFLRLVRERFMDLMDEDSLEFVQLSALLGSFYLYHSHPRSSFSILGAATKTAQAIGLHREPDGRYTAEDAEERKRVWWTIYTWDRFATIIYGRPLGINDRDCNVSMPSDFTEDIRFDSSIRSTGVCLSTYQTQLNMIYQIASPVLENMFRIRTSNDLQRRSQLLLMICAVDESLQRWQNELPVHLSYDRIEDISNDSSTEEKMHKLQALALKLTYDNLVIIVNRPLLADRTSSNSHSDEEARADAQRDHESEINTGNAAFKRCLDSALSISRVLNKKRLIQLARQTHLVSFLGINLFTASVVMFICALSDVLSNVSQEAKRGMARTLRLQKSLSAQASLSMQCSMILEDLVQLVLEKEREEIFQSAPGNGDNNRPTVNSINNAFIRNDAYDATPSTTSRSIEDPFATFSDTTWNTTDDDLRVEDVQFRQSLDSLYRVFHGNSLEIPHTHSENIAPGYRQVGQNPMQEAGQFVGYTLEGNGFGNANARIEDLGQFWLWDI
ncbi:fungal-specific transcription factor domain-containing protein [Halenospora varia]|nr:fungal-specific transcription factor domain-containing protein [Halenospora varia]